ncbi:hypothetical protein HS088_TW15G01007 [Tripterygium wilfordii]|uniref:Uncharacterized protein n=1 Tax=Tripterygium wilfordii TaxID=458696 RepID=A0A7J7CN56_TRIWF|nr:protein ALTERED PHOSPHATE STARVATION RESPONSE 1 [Tripterygium wilfordii]KAF5735500.1 hypothetical protein HS088_TW15G01007 [Tripterygium wilfordii]
MGCGGSKVDDLPVVTLCRERRDFIKAASHHRYALAAAHVSYFHSLTDVGEAIRKFVDEELVIGSGSSPGSPVLTLPSDEGKSSKSKDKNKISSSSTSISHSVDSNHIKLEDEDEENDIEDSHLHLSDSDSDSERGSSSGHLHTEEISPERVAPPISIASPPPNYFYPYSYPVYPPQEGGYSWGPPVGNPNPYMYYMKKSATPSQSVVYDPSTNSYAYPGSYGNGGFFGYPMGSLPPQPSGYPQPSPERPPPPAPPSPPRVSNWDFLNVFDTYDATGAYSGYGYPQGKFSSASSPDSNEVREREGIPDLEEETEQEVLKETHKAKKKSNEEVFNKNKRNINVDSGEGTSRSIPMQMGSGEFTESVKAKGIKSSSGSLSSDTPFSPDTIVSRSTEEEYAKRKSVSFEVEEASPAAMDVESSMPSSVTTLSAHGTRDVQEVVKEIRDEFEIASSYGKAVALLLEVDKLPYQHRSPIFKVIFSRILYSVAPSMLSSHPARSSLRLSSKTMKMAKAYCGEPGKDFDIKSGNLSSTLEKLYAWEKKLYKEVKDEEKLRIIYEKKCKELRTLDEKGAEASKIDFAQASVHKLLTKINISIRGVDAISRRIHKLRDEELQPQLTELIRGLTTMWKSMFKCHQKQFQALMESKARSLKARGGFRRDSGMKATLDLEMELLNWCNRFNNWINTQKSYVDTINEWLKRCLLYEPEETPDGIVPFSPGRIGAPPVFMICNDWCQAMDRITEKGVANTMIDFASSLHQLWERLDDEQRQRIKAEYLSKDFETQLRTLRMEREKMETERDGLSERTAVSKVPSGSGVSPLDDLKVDLDSMRKKLEEERARHKEAIKLVHVAASSSLQAGLIPIFEALSSFTSEIMKAHEQIRLDNDKDS